MCLFLHKDKVGKKSTPSLAEYQKICNIFTSEIADHHKGAEDVYKNILSEISIYSTDAKIKIVKDEKGKIWNNFEKELKVKK